MLGDDASRALNNSVLIRMRGELNLEVLQSSLQLLVERHDSLRTFFDSGRPEQEIVSNLALQIPMADWSGLAPEQQHTSLREEFDHERRQVFELTQAPLMRTKIIKLGPSDHVLRLTFHHLVTDGWSVGVLLHELKQLYNAQCQGQAWYQPAMQYSEYVKFQSDPSKRDLANTAESYWLKQFVEIPPPLDLPSDHPRPPRKTFRAARADGVDVSGIIPRCQESERTTKDDVTHLSAGQLQSSGVSADGARGHGDWYSGSRSDCLKPARGAGRPCSGGTLCELLAHSKQMCREGDVFRLFAST